MNLIGVHDTRATCTGVNRAFCPRLLPRRALECPRSPAVWWRARSHGPAPDPTAPPPGRLCPGPPPRRPHWPSGKAEKPSPPGASCIGFSQLSPFSEQGGASGPLGAVQKPDRGHPAQVSPHHRTRRGAKLAGPSPRTPGARHPTFLTTPRSPATPACAPPTTEDSGGSPEPTQTVPVETPQTRRPHHLALPTLSALCCP